MLPPGTLTPAFTISQLDQTQSPTTALAGALIETELDMGGGVRKNTQTTLEQLADFLATILGTGSAPGFSFAFRPNGDLIASPELSDYLDAGGEIYWISPDATGNRTTISAKSFGVAPGNTASANAAGMDALRTSLLG